MSVEKRFCKYCGNEIDKETNKCTGCGKQYHRINVKKFVCSPIWFIVSISIFLLIVSFGAYYIISNSLKPKEDEYTVSQYNEACSLDYSGKFEEAAEIFLKIGYYKDSSEKYVESMKSYSDALIESHNYDKAYGILEDLYSQGSLPSDRLIDDCCEAAGAYYNDEKKDFIPAYDWYKKAKNEAFVKENIDIVLGNIYNSLDINYFENLRMLKILNDPNGVKKEDLDLTNNNIHMILILKENSYPDKDEKLQKYYDLIH